MKGKKMYRISKVETQIYVKGFSGILVYKALYAILIAFGVFTTFYLLTSPFTALFITVPTLMIILYRLNKVQQTLGPKGYQKKQIARKLPHFVCLKQQLISLINTIQA